MNIWKRGLALLLCLLLCLGALPGTAWGMEAEIDGEPAGGDARVGESGTLLCGENRYWFEDGQLIRNGAVSEWNERDIRRIALSQGRIYAIVGDEETWLQIDSTDETEEGAVELTSYNAQQNKQTIFTFAVDTLGVSVAVACGILANVEAECSFDPTASCIDTNGLTSYGICQWNGSRFTNLKSFCSARGLDYTTLDAQLQFLQYELNGREKSAFTKVRDVEDSAQGAYDAGYKWARWFERCNSAYYERRAVRARDVFWAEYGIPADPTSASFNPLWPIGNTWPTTLDQVDAFSMCITAMYRYYNNGNPSNHSTRSDFHNAFDIGAASGTKIYAVETGTVVERKSLTTGFGNYIVIEHSNGLRSLYGHMNQHGSYNIGDTVSRGAVIGYCGTTGNSTGNHLHFELYNPSDLTRVTDPWGTYYQGKVAMRIGGNCYRANKGFTNSDSYAAAFCNWLLSDDVGGSASQNYWFVPTANTIEIDFRASTTKATSPDVPDGGVTFNQGDVIFINGRINSGGPMTVELYVTPPGGTESGSPVDSVNNASTWFWLGSGADGYKLTQSGTYFFRLHAISGGNTKDYAAQITSVALDTTVHVTGVSLDKSALELQISSWQGGTSGTLSATVYPSNATDKSMTWSSSNTAVATVDGNGTVTATGPGSATITVRTNDGGKTASCAVTVVQKYYLDLNGLLNGVNQTTLAGLGTADVYVNGVLRADDVEDYCVLWPAGTTYEVTDIHAYDGKLYLGSSTEAAPSGTITGNTSVRLAFVTKVPVTGVTLNKTSLTLNKGASETLTATVSPSNATNKSVTWSSSNTSVATVDSNGKVTAVSAGSTTVTVKTNDGGKTATCAVTVKSNTYTITYDANGGTGAPAAQTKTQGVTLTLSSTVPTRSGYSFLGWAESQSATAAQYQPGNPFTKDANTTLYAVWKSNVVRVTGVTLNKSSLTLNKGASETLIATVSPSNATNKTVTWSSSNTSVATVDGNGKVTAVSAGTATITVRTNDGGKTATCAVTVIKEASDNYPKLSVESVTVTPGSTVTVQVKLSESITAKSIMFDLFEYDRTALTLVDGEWNLDGAIINNWDSENEIATAAFSNNKTLSGTIFRLTFQTNAKEEGDYTIGFTPIIKVQTGNQESDVQITFQSGMIHVASYQRGDTNGDGYVTSDDAIYLLRHTLSPARYPINQSGDMNGDKYITSDDAIYLLRHTLSPSRYPLL